ncbi:hypothetical protein [Enterobacter sp.]|uniref:tail fiber/spike domain-containing protein n=1 Tax=Enterobacter sp. TaxID=42895 RepID=UPI00296E340C|nr:hypothetical protein [Enterobacter sp.]
MATQPTNLPVPSESPRDLKFNAGKIDEFVTSLVNTYVDRFGNEHYTIEGLRWLAQQAIAQYGWILIDSFQDGADITLPNQALRDEDTREYYRWDGSLPKHVDAGSTPASSGGVGTGAWVSIGDASLRAMLASSDDGKGDSLIAVKSPLAGAVARTQHDKNTDFRTLEDFGAIGDGTNHPLSERFSTLAAAKMVYPFVTSLTQSVDWAAAMAASAVGGFSMLDKKYSLSDTLKINGKISIKGKGDGESHFIFTGTGDGIVITLANDKDSKFSLSGFSILRTGLSTASSKTTALKIDGRAKIVTPGSSTTLATLAYRTEFSGGIEDIRISGADVEKSGWWRGIHLISVLNFRIHGFSYCGYVSPTPNTFYGEAIVIAGDGYVVDFSISRFWIYFCDTGILFPDYVEGPHIYDFEMMNVNKGIVGGTRLPETVVPDVTGQISSPGVLSPWIHDCHVNSLQECILMPSNCNLPKIDKINFFCNPLASDTQGRAAISLSYCSSPQITNAYFLMDRAANTAYLDLNSAIFLGAVAGARVEGVIVGAISNRGNAVLISGGTIDSHIGSVITNAKYGIAEAGPTINKNNCLGKVLNGFGTSRFNLPTSRDLNSFDYEMIHTTRVVTLTGTGGVAEGIINITPAGKLSEIPSSINVSIAYSDNQTATAYYDFDGSTVTNLRIRVRTQALTGSKIFRVYIQYPLT